MNEPLPHFRSSDNADPYAFYRYLQTVDPVHPSEEWGRWLVTRHADVVALLRDPRLSAVRWQTAEMGGMGQNELEQVNALFATQMLFCDPPNHTRLRGLVSKAFAPRVIEAMRANIARIANDLLDAVQLAGNMEVIADFAHPLPVIVIAEMLGVSPDDRPMFKKWSDDFILYLDGGTLNVAESGLAQSLGELTAYFLARVESLRRNPQDNLLSALAAAQEQGDRLSAMELVSNSLLLLVAGHETTTNLISNGLLSLLQNPDQFQLLREDPTLLPTAIEEFLRYESPVQWTDRAVKEDVEIGGRHIRAGEWISFGLGAANRDPAAFADPDRLDITRPENRHVAFGHGPHFCLGAALARLEGQVAFEVLLRRLPALRLEPQEIVWRDSVTFRRLNALALRF